MNLEPIIQSEVKKREMNWTECTYLQGSSGDAGIEKSLVNTVREEEGGTN